MPRIEKETLYLYGFGGLGRRALEHLSELPVSRPVRLAPLDAPDATVLAHADLPPHLAGEKAETLLDVDIGRWGIAVWGAGGTVGARHSYLLLSLARRRGAKMLSFVVRPFTWEAREMDGYTIRSLSLYPHIIVENDVLVRKYPHLPMLEALSVPFDLLGQVVRACCDAGPDFMDIEPVRVGVGYGKGVGRNGAEVALREALSSPFLHGRRVLRMIYRGRDEDGLKRAMRNMGIHPEWTLFMDGGDVSEVFILTS